MVDLDITLIDRMSAFVNLQNICTVAKETYNWTDTSPAFLKNSNQSKTNIKVISPAVTVKIRFPQPDFRPHSDWRDRWWARHVRADYLSLVLHEMSFFTCLCNQLIQEYTVQCRNMNIDYYEEPNSAPIHIAKAGYEDEQFSSLRHMLPECK